MRRRADAWRMLPDGAGEAASAEPGQACGEGGGGEAHGSGSTEASLGKKDRCGGPGLEGVGHCYYQPEAWLHGDAVSGRSQRVSGHQLNTTTFFPLWRSQDREARVPRDKAV